MISAGVVPRWLIFGLSSGYVSTNWVPLLRSPFLGKTPIEEDRGIPMTPGMSIKACASTPVRFECGGGFSMMNTYREVGC